MPLPSVSRTLAALLLLGAAGCGGDTDRPAARPSSPAGPTVTVVRLAFTPAEITVPAGTTVTWRSDEPISHTVTSGQVSGVDPATGLRAGQTPDGRFDGPLPNRGSVFTHRFVTPGRYGYYCAIHHGMNATVTVT